MKKKMLSLALALIMVMSFLPMNVIAATPVAYLREMQPLTQRTYNKLDAADSDVYGYGGPVVSEWMPAEKANTGEQYDNGVKIKSTGSWTISRFAVDYYVNSQYDYFTGHAVIHETAKNYNNEYYVRILGDGRILFTSEIMKPGTLPQPFAVNLTGVKTLTIEAKGVEKGQFYNYDSLGIVNAEFYKGGAMPSPTPAKARSIQATNIEDFFVLAQKTFNKSNEEVIYGYGGPAVENWEFTDKANTGTSYNSGVKFRTTGSWSIPRFAIDYFTNKQFGNFSGTFVIHENAKNYSDSYYVRILGDGRVLYTSDLMQPGALPQDFNVDISNAKVITIEAKSAKDKVNAFYNYNALGVVNAVFSPGGSVPTPTQPPVQTQPPVVSGNSVELSSLTPMSLKTYNRLNDLDTDVYGYGGPKVENWEFTDKANTGSGYDTGVKVSTTGSWSISRFVVDYYMGKQYNSLSGKFVIHENAKNYSTPYYVRIFGDGRVLYTSDLIQPGTLPQEFNVDLTNVNILSFEAKGTKENTFYNYASLGIVDAYLNGGTSTPKPTEPPTQQGVVVSGLTASALDVGVKLNWNAMPGALGYRVFRADSSTSEGQSVTDFYVTNNELFDVNVNPDTTYYYYVKVVMQEADYVSSEVLGEKSNVVQVRTGDVVQTGTNNKYIVMTLNDSYMNANGKRKEIDPGRSTVPQSVNNRTLVPIRAIVEEMGGTVEWFGNEGKIVIQYNGTTLEMWLNGKQMRVNGQTKSIDVPPMAIQQRTMLPIRFVGESLNCQVSWINSSRQIVIVYK